MSKGKKKFSAILQQIKKLSPERQKFWLSRIKALKDSASKTKELGVEPVKSKVIQLPAQTIVGTVSQAQRDWLLDTANWFDKIYNSADQASKNVQNKVFDAFDQATLAYANELDKVYTAVSNEVAKVPATAGKAIGDLTGTGGYWPYLLGAGAALAVVYYFTQISPIRRFI